MYEEISNSYRAPHLWNNIALNLLESKEIYTFDFFKNTIKNKIKNSPDSQNYF